MDETPTFYINLRVKSFYDVLRSICWKSFFIVHELTTFIHLERIRPLVTSNGDVWWVSLVLKQSRGAALHLGH